MGINPCNVSSVEEYKNNTPGVYLQVAGADGIDGIAEGFHLRWSLTDALGSNHLPKGNYYNSSGGNVSGFNKPDDYIRISRIPYTNPVSFNINFEQEKPIVNFSTKTWNYTINQQVNKKKTHQPG
ncbi:hypothetical protein [Pedobacter sp. NJ-S-72]